MNTRPTRWTVARDDLRRRAALRAERQDLARDLAVFESASDLTDLAALLERYDDAATEDIRSLVDWTKAA